MGGRPNHDETQCGSHKCIPGIDDCDPTVTVDRVRQRVRDERPFDAPTEHDHASRHPCFLAFRTANRT